MRSGVDVDVDVDGKWKGDEVKKITLREMLFTIQ